MSPAKKPKRRRAPRPTRPTDCGHGETPSPCVIKAEFVACQPCAKALMLGTGELRIVIKG